ncbi:MAG: ureidoglycolate lyase [Pseudomonadota bacterium]
MNRLTTEPLSAAAFAPFGDVIAPEGTSFAINDGLCQRFHDLARLDFGPGGRAGVSLAVSQAIALPHALSLVERHPLGSQMFVPLTPTPFLVTVAPDEEGRPGTPRAFIATSGQGVNYLRGTWHGVLAPLAGPARFLVVDRIAPDDAPNANLNEWLFETFWTIV